jgi:hypothetical protein
MTKVEMSCGGGMGGSHWYEYGWFKTKPQIGQATELVEFVSAVSGETKTINPNFIVTFEDKKLVKTTTDVTAWRNFGVKRYKKSTHIAYYCFDITDEVSGDKEKVKKSIRAEEIKNYCIYSEVIDEFLDD